jgi:hypothetical protein
MEERGMSFIHCNNPILEEQVTKSCPICNPKPKKKQESIHPGYTQVSPEIQMELQRQLLARGEGLRSLVQQGYYPNTTGGLFNYLGIRK